MSWAVFLAAIAGTVAKKVLIALGFGLVTYIGYNILVDQLQAWIQLNLNRMSSDVYSMFALIGLIDSIGIWLGAFATIAARMAIQKLERLAS